MPTIVIPAEVYEIIAQGARYWFLFLMVMIAWRSYRWLARNRKQRKKRLRLLPDAGYIGEMVVQKGNEELQLGDVLPVPREGVLGIQRGCDLFVPVRGVSKRHLWFRYEDGKGLMVKTFGKHTMSVDGETYAKRGSQVYLSHGSRLTVGDAVLRLRMFAGFEGAVRATSQVDASTMPPGAVPQAAMTPQQLALWQQQYWLMTQQAMMAQAIQARQLQQNGQASQNDNNEGSEMDTGEDTEIVLDSAYPETDMDALETEASFASDATLDEISAQNRRSLFNPFASEPDDAFYGEMAGESELPDEQAFDPTALGEDDAWPYLPYPQSDVLFENQGYTYPELIEDLPEDEDLTDAAAPPKSLYVGKDEAERAKRVLWDKYLGGGKKQ